MLLPCTRMAIKTNLNNTKLTSTTAAARANVQRGLRPTRILPHQEFTSSGMLLFASACTALNSNRRFIRSRVVVAGMKKQNETTAAHDRRTVWHCRPRQSSQQLCPENVLNVFGDWPDNVYYLANPREKVCRQAGSRMGRFGARAKRVVSRSVNGHHTVPAGC